jgi:hypothetical protein
VALLLVLFYLPPVQNRLAPYIGLENYLLVIMAVIPLVLVAVGASLSGFVAGLLARQRRGGVMAGMLVALFAWVGMVVAWVPLLVATGADLGVSLRFWGFSSVNLFSFFLGAGCGALGGLLGGLLGRVAFR